MRMYIRAMTVLIGVAAATPVWGHHGFGTFETNKTVSFPGATLTKLEFINPHSWLYFEVRDASGKVQKMRCEMRSAHVLRRSGWDGDMFRSGQRVDITASPDRADPVSITRLRYRAQSRSFHQRTPPAYEWAPAPSPITSSKRCSFQTAR